MSWQTDHFRHALLFIELHTQLNLRILGGRHILFLFFGKSLRGEAVQETMNLYSRSGRREPNSKRSSLTVLDKLDFSCRDRRGKKRGAFSTETRAFVARVLGSFPVVPGTCSLSLF